MSSSESKGFQQDGIQDTSIENDPYAIFDRVVDTLWERTELALEKDQAARISDDVVGYSP